MTIPKLIAMVERICRKTIQVTFKDIDVEVNHNYLDHYPKGEVSVSGSYDDNSGEVCITLISSFNDSEVFDFNDKSYDWFNSELVKVLKHEKIHIEQDLRDDFSPSLHSDQHTYFSDDLEIEAYGRADVPLEVRESSEGSSKTVEMYIDMFGKDSDEVRKLLHFYKIETGLDYPLNYMTSNTEDLTKAECFNAIVEGMKILGWDDEKENHGK